MQSTDRRIVSSGPSAGVCLGLLCVLLIAGLWPFHAPKNDVTWLADRGLHFGHYGTAISRGPFPGSADSSAGTLELWVQPDAPGSSRAILSFECPSHPLRPFVI